jgi:glucan 1,3-beta-glucosidase
MPANDSRRNRDRRNSRDPTSDNDLPRESYRRRKGHRPTDSTGELLPKVNPNDDSTNSTPRKSRRRDSSSNPLSSGNLTSLDKAVHKQNRKRGHGTYDEAYLQDVRDKEAKMEKDKRRASRDGRKRRESRAATDDERQARQDLKREAEREQRRQERRSRRTAREAEPVDEVIVTEHRKSTRRRYSEDPQPNRSRNTAKPHEDWHRRPKYERIETPTSKKKRVMSGPFVEDARAEKVYSSKPNPVLAFFQNYKKWIYAGLFLIILLLIIIIPAVVVSSKKKSSASNNPSTGSTPSNGNLAGISASSIPAQYKGTYYDPFSWYDTTDFNVTFTTDTVGGLPIMGLDSKWDNSAQPNSNVPALTSKFPYGVTPIRGMNLGGWLSIEPFITPSLFSKWSATDNVVDEWTLSAKLGTNLAATIEPHYSTFITKADFAAIKAAGFDHVRIPFSYWAVTTYTGDPYLAQTSWRYLLRGIEYARQNGLRVNLDLHGLPGSQNGMNHSGRQGLVGWLNGTDGDLNAQRSLDVHNQLSQFFSQPRYQNLVTMYGLGNEPKVVDLSFSAVLNWTETATRMIQGNGFNGSIIFGDGFYGLNSWKGQLQDLSNLVLDVHQYVIFDSAQLNTTHTDKLNYACSGWTTEMQQSLNKNTGFGPTMCGEWSQADTDCAQFLNDVGVGSRWEGTLNVPWPNQDTSVYKPLCPTQNNPTCECADANADPSKYSTAYKTWLLDFAEAQMDSFENGYGWFYWTWSTESAVQWSWKLGLAAGILPKTLTNRAFNCNMSIPDFGAMGLPENY